MARAARNLGRTSRRFLAEGRASGGEGKFASCNHIQVSKEINGNFPAMTGFWPVASTHREKETGLLQPLKKLLFFFLTSTLTERTHQHPGQSHGSLLYSTAVAIDLQS